MQDINTKELEIAIEKYGDIVLKKSDKNNVVIMSVEQYNKELMRNDIIEKLKKSEKEIERGEGIDSDEVFKELKTKYEY